MAAIRSRAAARDRSTMATGPRTSSRSLTAHELRHGEAVAIGLALDSRYSVQIGMLAAGEEVRICTLLEKLGFTLWHDMLEKHDGDGNLAVLAGLREFREHLGGDLTVTLLCNIGVGEEVHEMHEGEINRAIDWLKQRRERR